MLASDKALVRSLIAVAWADGKIAEDETILIDSLIESFGADDEDTAELREFAAAPRSLDDVPLGDLDHGDRRRLLQLAVMVSFVDGAQDETERTLIDELAVRLEIPEAERAPLLQGSAMRAKGLLRVMQA